MVQPKNFDSASTTVTADVLEIDADIGEPTDVAAYVKGTTSSPYAYLKGIIDALGLVSGTVTTGTSTTAFADTGLAAYATNFFRGAVALFTTGANAGQSKQVATFSTTTGAITTANSYANTPSIGDKFLIIGFAQSLGNVQNVPATDGTVDLNVRDVVGSKGDTASPTITATTSIVRYIKGLLQVLAPVSSAATSAGTTSTLNDTARTEANNYWRGATLQIRSGANAGLARPIVSSVQNTSVTVYPPFPNSVGSGDAYVIMGDARILDQTDVGTFTVTAVGGTGEQTIIDTATPQGSLQVFLDFSNLTQDSTVKVYRKIDGTNYRLMKSYSITDGVSADGFYSDYFLSRNGIKATITMSVAEGADRDLPYEVLCVPFG